MTYNPYNFTFIPFDLDAAKSVLWQNSELVIALLIVIALCQVIQTAFRIVEYIKGR